MAGVLPVEQLLNTVTHAACVSLRKHTSTSSIDPDEPRNSAGHARFCHARTAHSSIYGASSVLDKKPMVLLLTPHLFRSATMVNLVVLWAAVLPLLQVAVTGSVPDPGDQAAVSSEVDVDLDLNFPEHSKVAAAWWAGWHPNLLPLDKISWKKYTHMTYAFA